MPKTGLAAALALVAGAIAFAGEGVVEGKILDSNGKPLAGATVRAGHYDRETGYRSVTAETDEKGVFRLEGAELGENRISVNLSKPGDKFSVDVAKLELGKKPAKLDFRLAKTDVAGKIALKESGKPPAYPLLPQISFYSLVEEGGEEVLGESAGMAFMEKDGSFRIRGFPPGRYRMIVYLKGHRNFEKDLTVKKGKAVKGLEVVFEPKKSGLVRFTVVDEEGEPLEGADFSRRTKRGSATLLVEETDDLGVYETKELEGGTWVVYVHRKGYAAATVEVEVKEGKTTEVKVELKPE